MRPLIKSLLKFDPVKTRVCGHEKSKNRRFSVVSDRFLVPHVEHQFSITVDSDFVFICIVPEEGDKYLSGCASLQPDIYLPIA